MVKNSMTPLRWPNIQTDINHEDRFMRKQNQELEVNFPKEKPRTDALR